MKLIAMPCQGSSQDHFAGSDSPCSKGLTMRQSQANTFQGVYDCTHALDRILIAYGQIGNNMPRLTRYANAFPQHQDFQRLVGFLFEDIMEFHRKAYSMICKPGTAFQASSKNSLG